MYCNMSSIHVDIDKLPVKCKARFIIVVVYHLIINKKVSIIIIIYVTRHVMDFRERLNTSVGLVFFNLFLTLATSQAWLGRAIQTRNPIYYLYTKIRTIEFLESNTIYSLRRRPQ